jgi:hypothetical protein
MNVEPTPFVNPLPGVPLIESPFFSRVFSAPGIDPELRRIAIDLHVKGYAVIDFPDADIERMAADIKERLLPRYDLDGWRASGHAAGISLRLQDAWEYDADVRRIACNEKILALLSQLYGRQAWPFQTLNFPVGTQQHFHTDSIHFSSTPERFMCGVWLALDDIDADNGPLVYYPGSHRWPIYSNEHVGLCVSEMDGTPTQGMYEAMWRALVEARGAQPQTFHAKKGQALIWAANLMHGGSRQLDPQRTRWSQVTHYFFEDCAYYTPMMSDVFYGRIDFRKLRNVVTGEVVPHQYAGRALAPAFVAATRSGSELWKYAFDAALYLEANPDVKAAGVNAAEHYLMHGFYEGRKLRP